MADLGKKELDLIKFVNTAMVKKVSKIFSTLVGKNIRMNFRQSVAVTVEEAQAKFSGDFLCLKYKINQDINKTGVLVVPKKMAVLLSELLLGKEAKQLPADLVQSSIDVCGQGLAKVLDAMGTAIAQQLEKKFVFNLQETLVCPVSQILPAIAEKEVVISEYGLGIEGFFESEIVDITGSSFGKIIADAGAGKVAGSQKISGASFGEFASVGGQSVADTGLLLDTPLSLSVELGHTRMSLKEVMELGVGSIVELDKLAGEPVDIKINNKLLAKGEVVVIDENFGVRLVNIVKPNERI